MSWLSDFFTSPQARANQDIYDEYNKIKNVGDVESTFGLKRRKAADVQSIFNPARATLATRQAQENANAASRMSGSNATPQATLGSITSSFAPAWGELESKAAETGLNVERSDEERIAEMFDRQRQEKQQAAGGLSKTSGFDDVLGVAGTVAKFIPPVAATANVAGVAGNPSSFLSKFSPNEFKGLNLSFLSNPPAMSSSPSSPLNVSGGLSEAAPSLLAAPDNPMATMSENAIPGMTGDDGQWGMNKRHGYNRKTGVYGFWETNNPDVDFLQ
jgi:hypothetical protein